MGNEATKSGFGHMAGKGSRKRPYSVKKFDANYLPPSDQNKSCATCRHKSDPMWGPADGIKGRCRRTQVFISDVAKFRCTRWESR